MSKTNTVLILMAVLLNGCSTVKGLFVEPGLCYVAFEPKQTAKQVYTDGAKCDMTSRTPTQHRACMYLAGYKLETCTEDNQTVKVGSLQ